MEQHILGHGRYQLGQAASSLTSLAALALILFIMPKMSGSNAAAMSGYVLVSLYLMGPMGSLLRMLPLLTAADIAHRRVQELGIALGEKTHEPQAKPGDRERSRSIELHDVVHTYRGEKNGAQFQLGPISLELRPAQVLFITGENGSGKSTLAKLLVGLYEPEAGEITWNDEPVSDRNRDSYRQLFTVVHSDHFLFTSLLGLEHDDLDAQASRWLERLQLEERVSVENGKLSTLRLSQGQKKRLALLTAYLEDRPVFVFDEWAADQDPEFKEVFYRELLPELRERGKAIVVITHDDRYFELSDRRIQLTRGALATSR
jgi:putative ATP-binding cassette transporter